MVDDSQNVTNLMVVICTKMGELSANYVIIPHSLELQFVELFLSKLSFNLCDCILGITNHDEYSLVRELQDENDMKENYGTLTLRRKKEEKERDAKMEQLRKKLKTDDESKL